MWRRLVPVAVLACFLLAGCGDAKTTRDTSIAAAPRTATSGVENLTPRSAPTRSLQRFTCRGTDRFPAAVLAGPGHAERGRSDLAAGLRHELKAFPGPPIHGWHLVTHHGRFASFLRGRGPQYNEIGLQRTRGRWSFAFSGACGPRTVRDGITADTQWSLRKRAHPTDTTLQISVTANACASGRSADGRILQPDIHYGRDAITLTAYVRPLTGYQTCIRRINDGAPATIHLDQPIGHRTLRDGATLRPHTVSYTQTISPFAGPSMP